MTGVFKKLFKKTGLFLKIIIALFCIIYFTVLAYIISFSWNKNVPKHADAIVVLGAKVNLDNSPSEALYNRTIEAVKLYKEHYANYIITTGGVGLGPMSEAEVAAKIAERYGVPEENIIIESSSHNTYENFYYLKKIAAERKIKSLIIVSDQFHIPRAVLTAKYFKFSQNYWAYPKLDNYYNNEEIATNYLREDVAWIYYFIKMLPGFYSPSLAPKKSL